MNNPAYRLLQTSLLKKSAIPAIVFLASLFAFRAFSQQPLDKQTDQIITPTTQAARTNDSRAEQTARSKGVTANTAAPASVRPFELIYAGEHLLGDWWGFRTALEDRGITPTFNIVTDVAGNPSGGRRQGVASSTNIGLDFQFDLEKIVGLKGGSFLISTSDRFGNSLTNDYIGNAFNVQQNFGGGVFKVIDVAYRQKLFDDHLEFRVGRVAAGDDFLVSSYNYLFEQNGADGNPVGVFFNSPGMTAYPNAAWGGWLKIKPTDRTYIMAGVYNGDPTTRVNNRHGVDLSLRGPAFAIAEAGFQLNGRKTDNGLIGDYKLGGWYDTNRFVGFTTGNVQHHNGGIYLIADQAIIPFGPRESGRGLGLFGSVLISPDEQYSTLPYFFTGGIAARGPFASRPHDSTGVDIVYGHFSSDLNARDQFRPPFQPRKDETVIEVTYRFSLGNGSAFFQPDLQYIIQPNGNPHAANATVLGCQVGLNF